MVEMAAHRTGVWPPTWTSDVKPLAEPRFIDPSLSLRLHLLTSSPPPFRRRQYFHRFQPWGSGLMLTAARIGESSEELDGDSG